MAEGASLLELARLSFEPAPVLAHGDQYVASAAGALITAGRLSGSGEARRVFSPGHRAGTTLVGPLPATAPLKEIERAVSDPAEIVQ
jgi:hypothetical protein